MKKIMLFLAIIVIVSVKNVFAQDQYKLTLEKQNGIYFSRRGDNFQDDSYPYYLYKFGDIFAYCIEPGKHITTYTYVGEEEFVDLDFSDELKEKLELIGYYGRDYPGHDNIRYSMATQALIWELTGVDTVTFWTKQNEKGEEIDVSKERNEILELVSNHKTLPNLKKEYQGYLKHKIEIEDTNNVIDSYEVIDNEFQDISISNNKITIIPKKIGTYNIELVKKNYNEYKTIIFVGKGDNSTQKIARLHFNKEIKTNFTLSVDGIRLLVHKKDENNNLIKIPNIKFKIKDLTRDKDICSGLNDCLFITRDDGSFITMPLDYGEYEIEEIEKQIIPGYSWNKNKLHITINENTMFNYDEENNNYIDLDFINHHIKGSLEINKTGEQPIFQNNDILYEKINLEDIEFDLFTIDNQYIKTFKTNSDGYARVDNLSLGKYYLIEKTKLNNYIEKDKIVFEIKQENQYQEFINVKLEIANILKKGQLLFKKEDLVTSQGIPNTIIEIYDEDNHLLFTKKTDENGLVIINDLSIGKYYIIEKEANSLYVLTNEKVFFEIKEDGEIVKAHMTNEKIEIPVPKTSTKEGIIAHSIFGIIFLIGIGRMYYEKKSTY